jgi:hypothetical protein
MTTKYQTESGRVFAGETRGVVRSLAAKKAAGTRRAKAVQRWEKNARDRYTLSIGNRYETFFLVAEVPLAELVAQLVEGFHDTGAHSTDAWGWGDDGDLVVWNAGRVVALVRRGPGGDPVATIF